MANIFTTSIGKKVIMSLSGFFLILFLTLHACLNAAYLWSPEAFNHVCEFMSLPIIKIVTPILAFGIVIHIIYAFVLFLQDYKARGKERYEVANKTKADGWASKNMLVLGVVVLLGMALHLTHFWAKMQLQEFLGNEPLSGAEAMVQTFKPRMVLLHLDAPYPRFLERIPVHGMEQQQVDQETPVARLHLLHSNNPDLCSSCHKWLLRSKRNLRISRTSEGIQTNRSLMIPSETNSLPDGIFILPSLVTARSPFCSRSWITGIILEMKIEDIGSEFRRSFILTPSAVLSPSISISLNTSSGERFSPSLISFVSGLQ